MTGSSQQTPEEAMAPDVIKAEAEKNTNLQKHSAYMQELRTISSSYNAELLYSKRMTELQTNLEQENKQLQIDIDNIIGPTRTDDRRMVYETHESAHLLWIRKIFVLIYYLILLIYLFTSRFFPDQQYFKWRTWVYLILYILFPFLLDFLSRNLISLYEKIAYIVSNKIPRNVYL